MTYPTISISLNDDRAAKVRAILRALREQDDSISRSEAIGRAIDHFFLAVCPLQETIVVQDIEAADIAK